MTQQETIQAEAEKRYPTTNLGKSSPPVYNLFEMVESDQQAFIAGSNFILNNQWVEVSKELPELTEPLMGYNDDNVREVFIPNYKATVWAYNEEMGAFKAELTKRSWTEVSSISCKVVNPTHWMPLPENPTTNT